MLAECYLNRDDSNYYFLVWQLLLWNSYARQISYLSSFSLLSFPAHPAPIREFKLLSKSVDAIKAKLKTLASSKVRRFDGAFASADVETRACNGVVPLRFPS